MKRGAFGDNLLLKLGTLNDDILDGTQGNDLLLAFDGNDRINLLNGVDVALGGTGDDTFVIGNGLKVLSGGDGENTFELTGSSVGIVIMDWTLGDNTIDLSALGVTSFDELSIAITDMGTEITGDGFKVVLQGFTAPDGVQADDFEFAVQNTVVNFDDLQSGSLANFTLPLGYADFFWTGFFGWDTSIAPPDEVHGFTATSGTNLAFSLNFAQVQAADVFDFESFVGMAAYRNDVTLVIQGYEDGVLLGEQVVTLNFNTPTVYELDDAIFDQVDRVDFLASGGVQVPGASGNAPVFGVDDLVFVI